METLMIVGILSAIGIIAWISSKVNSYSLKTYEFQPFGFNPMFVSLVGTVAIGLGFFIWGTDIVGNLRNATGTFPITNQIVFLCIGAVLHIGLFVFLTIRTSLVIAIWAVVVLLPTSVVMMIIFFALSILAGEVVKSHTASSKASSAKNEK